MWYGKNSTWGSGAVAAIGTGRGLFWRRGFLFGLLLSGMAGSVYAQTTNTFNSSGTFVVPTNVYEITVEAWGGGGGGSTRTSNGVGGGGGGGAYSRSVLSVNPGESYTVTVGAGGAATQIGSNTWFGSTQTVFAVGGRGVAANTNAIDLASRGWGGSRDSGVGQVRRCGGNGAAGVDGSYGGGGGASAGTSSNGTSAVNQNGATAPAGGGSGGNGRITTQGDGLPGTAPGGGGGGGYRTGSGTRTGGAGAAGRVNVTYTVGGVATALDVETPVRYPQPNVASEIVRVRLVDAAGRTTTNAAPVQVNLSSAPAGVFRDAADSTAITNVLISAGSVFAEFRFVGTAVGEYTLTLTDNAAALTQTTQGLNVGLRPGIAETFYIPMPEDELLSVLSGVNVAAVSPVLNKISLAVLSANTLIYYDQYEGGYEASLATPTNVYDAATNLGGTQIWGDDDPDNGFPPGFPDDVIPAGGVIVLQDSVPVPIPGAGIYYGGRDKVGSTKAISMTRVGWASGAGTLLAGANEMFDTFSWGTNYLAPVGVNIPDAVDLQIFELTSLMIMAGVGGATVQVDANANGTFEIGPTNLVEGGALLVTNVYVGAQVISDNPVQIEMACADYRSNYEAGFYKLLPRSLWSDKYVTPVSTTNAAQGQTGTVTTVWLYNSQTNTIAIDYRTRNGSGNVVTNSLNVLAGSYVRQVLPDLYGASFTAPSGEVFYALSATDSGSTATNANGYSGNQAWDWGYTLVPETSLSPQILVGLGTGRDPLSLQQPQENGNPIWVTPVGNGDSNVTIYVDFDADPATGPLVDPNGFRYDVALSLKELERAKVYNPSGDQTGMLLYTLAPGIKLAAAWGQDLLTASAGQPGLDVGSGVPPLPQFFATKRSVLWVDQDADGYISPGDILQYTVEIENISRVPVDDMTVEDTLPASVDYVTNTTFFTDHTNSTVSIPDNTLPASLFPLDNGGITLPISSLPPGGMWRVSYDVEIKNYTNLPPGTISIINGAVVNSTSVDDPIEVEEDEPLRGRIGDLVWQDLDADGIQDAGEPGIAGVTVRLYDGVTNLLATTVTDVSGNYLFTGLLTNDYQVEFVPPAGYSFSPQNSDAQGLRGPVNSDAAATGSTGVFTLDGGEPLLQVDAGLVPTGSIGDRVWLDENADGIQDAGEDGIANVTVRLYDDTGTNLLAQTVTDTEGTYRFTGLIADDYVVQIVTNSMPAGLTANPTYDLDGTNTAHVTDVTLATGANRVDSDFGYNWSPTTDVVNGTGTGAIGDRIWNDTDGDGVQDPGEPGLAGIEVRIYYDANTNGMYTNLFTAAVDQNGNTGTGITTNSADGRYVFDALPAGSYVIVVNNGATPGGYTQTGDPDYFGQTLPVGDRDNKATTPIVLAPGDVFVNADFGYQPTTSFAIEGTVYFDANANSNLNAGVDYGITVVTVALLDTNGVVIATTRTDTNGFYQFTGLQAGEYTVWVNDTGNLLDGLEQTEDPDATRDDQHTVTIIAANISGIDFGYTRDGHTVTTGLIGDRIWLDRDGDGVQDAGESGLQGVTVQLYDNTGTNLLGQTTTDANGNYAFGALATNSVTYIVRVDTISLPNGGVGLTNTGDPDGGTAHEASVTLTGAAPIDLDQDFGYNVTVPNAIGGTIWEDRNANGNLAGSETNNGLAGVTVTLTDTNGNVVATTVTDADGDYLFTGLPDGTYRVDVTDTANVLNGYWHSAGPTAGADNNSQSDPYTVAVSGGQTNTTADFGYYVDAAALGNRVWLDANVNGIQDAGEVGMTNTVLLRLTIVYGNGTTNVVTTLSNTNGFYSFGNLLLDEHQDGTNAASPVFTISAINPATNFNHTVFNHSGTPAANDSDRPSGVVATTWQGQTLVTLNTNLAAEASAAWYDFGFSLAPTLAVITGVRSRIGDGVAVISWDVSLEIGTVGYALDRWVNGAWLRISGDWIMADLITAGTKTYEQRDPDAPIGSVQRYQIVELDTLNRQQYYGPYDLDLDGGEISYAAWAEGIDWGAADSAPNADPDRDGLTNWQEYLAGTDPLSANSVLRVSSLDRIPEGIRLRWTSVEGRLYAIEMAPSLVGMFQAIATDIPDTAPENVYVVPVPPEHGQQGFYRVIVK